jgi:hypothetical protein
MPCPIHNPLSATKASSEPSQGAIEKKLIYRKRFSVGLRYLISFLFLLLQKILYLQGFSAFGTFGFTPFLRHFAME